MGEGKEMQIPDSAQYDDKKTFETSSSRHINRFADMDLHVQFRYTGKVEDINIDELNTLKKIEMGLRKENTNIPGALLILLLLNLSSCHPVNETEQSRQPNLILIYCDDLGYGDLSCYGSVWNQTPEIDKMAGEGLRFTDFYAGAAVCTPSRAALLTGCYSRRVDMDLDEQNRWVLFPGAKKGLNPDETILPEMLKEAGYATAIIGKWHLGDQPQFLPSNHGFDYWFGLPYSNDMENEHRKDPPLPLLRNDSVIVQHARHHAFDQTTLTKKYTKEALQWISKNKNTPFFLYLAHTMPHNPAKAQEFFYQKTNNPKKGFGASVAEISSSTGELLNYLKSNNLDENTLVIFTSDNGGRPMWGASNGVLKGKKGQTHEGGIRVPCIAWWPGKIHSGTTCYNPASVIDLYATFSTLANSRMKDTVIRDGKDISEYLFNPDKIQEPRPFYYWHVGYLHAVRFGKWKLSLIGSFNEEERKNIKKSGYYNIPEVAPVELFNLNTDPGETQNVADKHPEMVTRLLKLIEDERRKLGQWNTKGPELRPTVTVEEPKPLRKH